MIDHKIHEHLQNIDIPNNYILVDPVLTSIVNRFDLDGNPVRLGSVSSYLRGLEQQDHRIILFQHDDIDKYIHLLHPTDIWFTCSSTIEQPDNVIAVPFTCNVVGDMDNNDRDRLFFYRGSRTTHPLREQLIEQFPDNCLDTGVHWAYNEEDLKDQYKEDMSKTKFAVCPRGYGIGSFRLFEALASGCVPIILADGYKKPLEDILDWDEFSITLPESEYRRVEEVAKENEHRFEEMQKDAKDAFINYLDIANFETMRHYNIEDYFKP